jgi:cardiolipin synthase
MSVILPDLNLPVDAAFGWWLVDAACAIYVVVHAIRARVSIAYIFLWGPAAILIPKSTALILLIWGGRKHSALAKAKIAINAAAEKIGEPAETSGNEFKMMSDRHGLEMLETLRHEIRNAQHRIHLSTYIFSADRTGKEIMHLLAIKAREGVEVRLLLDALGSWGTPTRLGRRLTRAGGKIARFNPVLPMQGKGSANWRNHRKIAVFDGKVAIVGGQNIGLKYMGDVESRGRFRDCSFCIAGPAAATIERVFIADWCQATDTKPEDFTDILRARPDARGSVNINVISSGPDALNDPLWEHYVRMIETAQRSVTVVTPYFVPDETIFRLLKAAAQRGLSVRILLPRKSDHKLLDFARRWYVRILQEAGAEILLFKPDVLHAKLFIRDDVEAVVGSPNLDVRSLFLNYEIGVVVTAPSALNEINGFVNTLAAESIPYSENFYQHSRTWTSRTLEIISKVLEPLL